MDIDKIVKFVVDYASEYFAAFVSTVINPVMRFSPESASSHAPDSLVLGSQTGIERKRAQLNPKLFGFMVISIFIGMTINALIPNRQSAPSLATSIVVIAIMWFLYSSVMHGICLMVGGRGSYEETLSVSIQVLSVLYVISSSIAFLLGVMVQTPPIYNRIVTSGSAIAGFANNPVYFFFVVQFILMTIYLPMALRSTHGFGRSRQFLVLILAPIAAFIAYSIYRGSGILYAIRDVEF